MNEIPSYGGNRLVAKNSEEAALFYEELQLLLELLAASYGPNPSVVITAGYDVPLAFDDGYKALSSYRPQANALRHAAVQRTLDVSGAVQRQHGDGSSLTGILFTSLLMNLRSNDLPAREVRFLLQRCKQAVLDYIDRVTFRDDASDGFRDFVVKVATTAAHGNSELGKLIGSAVFEAGKHAIPKIEMHTGSDIRVVRRSGYSFPCVPFEEFRSAVDKAMVVVIKDEQTNVSHGFKALISKWQEACRMEDRLVPLVVVGNRLSGPFLATLRRRVGANGESLPFFVAPAPDKAKMLDDMCKYLGIVPINKTAGQSLDNITAANVCFADVSITPNSVSFVAPDGVDVKQAITEDYDGLAWTQEIEDERDERLAAATSANVVVMIPNGAVTTMNAMYEVVDDCFRAAKSAMNGVVAGGGTALAKAADMVVMDEWEGSSLVKDALTLPFSIICYNSGIDLQCLQIPEEVVSFNANSGEFLPIQDENAVVDAADVVKSAVAAAFDAAAQVATVKFIIARADAI